MNSKMKSLKEFEMSQNEMNIAKGGQRPLKDYPVNITFTPGTGSMGTYVDGFKTGIDGYKD